MAGNDGARPVRTVLSLDGGGAHGMMTVHFIAELEQQLGFPIRDVFDAVAGTSLGAMLAASLVYNPEMTAQRARDEAFTFANAQRMMDWNLLAGPVLRTLPKYKGEVKRELIDTYIPDVAVGAPPSKNLVFIPAFDVSRGEGVVFKSYDRESALIDVPVRQAVDATSAAPTYFPSVKITKARPDAENGGIGTEFAVDGGLYMNNPCDSLYADLVKEWRDCDVRILSVGSGIRPKVPLGNPEIKRVPWSPFSFLHKRKPKPQVLAVAGEVTQYWGDVQWLSEGNLVGVGFAAPMEAVHHRMKRYTQVMGHQYLRVNMPLGRDRRIDDVSDENLRELADLGKEAAKKFGGLCQTLLHPRLEELRSGTAWDRSDFVYRATVPDSLLGDVA